MLPVELHSDDRLLVIAPHPDDELISCGILIQKALALGVDVNVVVASFGDAFGYAGPPVVRRSLAGRPGQALTRARSRQRLGLTRQKETVRALERIGLPEDRVQFLGYPDRGLTALWHRHFEKPFQSPYTLVSRSPYPSYTPDAEYTGKRLLDDLKLLIAQVSPTICAYPHPSDTHRDHSALSAFVTCALQELGDERFGTCKKLMYFVHLGGWPPSRSKSGNHFDAPRHKHLLHETYVQVVGDDQEVKAKQEAITAYRSQIPLLGRFLASFIRQNELFSLGPSCMATTISPDSMLVGLTRQADLEKKPLIPLPVRDRVTARVETRGDVSGIDVGLAGQTLLLTIGLQAKASADVECLVTIWTCPRGEEITLRCKPPDRVTVVGIKGTREHRGAVLRSAGKQIHLAIEGKHLGLPRSFFIRVTTKTRGLLIDNSGVHFVKLPKWGSAPDVAVFARASRRDLAACADIFKDAFSESLIHLFGRMPRQKLVRQVFHLFMDAEPEALMVAISDGRVVGYIYAPASLRHVWRAAFYEGHVRRWILAWARGRLSLGMAPIRLLLSNKYHFLRSAFRHDIAVDARVLSVAVDSKARALGIGTRLVQHALYRFRQLGVAKVRLEVRPHNEPAVRAYTRLGFEKVGETSDSQGAWTIMLCDLEYQERIKGPYV